MATTPRTLIHMPRSARRGEVIELRVTIAHPMETGYRTSAEGQRLPRDIIRRFACRYGGDTVFAADLYPAIAANPYLAFFIVASASGPVEFSWEGDNGFAHTERVPLEVLA